MVRDISESAIRGRLRSPVRCGRAGVALALCLLTSAPSWAQAPSSATASEQADAAFGEGRELFDQGRFREACEKFELSMHFEPSPGTLLNLGNCYEPQGDLVRALATFERALADAQKAKDAGRRRVWSDAARERIAALTPRIPELRVQSADPAVSVSLDGEPVAALGQMLRLNPGRHELTASAPGKRAYTQAFQLTAAQRLTLQLPALEAEVVSAPEPVSTEAPAPLSAPADEATRQRRFGPWPWVVGGTGAALLGTSLITGLMASSKASRLEEECNAKRCDESLQNVKDSAATLALATDVLWISGVLAVGAGVTLFLLDDAGTEAATAVQTGCFDVGCGILASGRF
jgi:tetratricopeptide (TPR) repeat protein